MKKMIMLGLTGLVLFGASAGGSWMFMQQNAETEDDSENETGDPPLAASTSNQADQVDQLPFQPDDISVNALIKMVSSIKSRESLLKSERSWIDQRKQRVDLALADLDREQQELQTLSSTIGAKLDRVQELVQRLEQQSPADASDASNSPAGEGADSLPYELENVKRLAELLQGLAPEAAAGTLKEFVNDGKMDLAALVMAQIETRNASKILGAVGDQRLIADLAKAILEIKNTD